MELSERKKQILKAIIGDYIRTAEPVGSKALTEGHALPFSSATIRNEMSELEEMGYLEKPHTSAGRIPSPQGYRLYVDELMEQPQDAGEEDDATLQQMMHTKVRELDRLIEEAGRIISSLTNYASVAVTPTMTQISIRRFEIIAVDQMNFVIVVVTDSGTVKNKMVRTMTAVSKDEAELLTYVLNQTLTGLPLTSITAERFDIVHTHTPVGGVLTRLAARDARRSGTRVLYTAHGFHFYKGAPLANWLLWYPVERVMSRLTDVLITINQEDYERAKRFAHCQVEYVPGVGVDLSRFAAVKCRDSKRGELGLAPDDFAMLSVGDLIPRKNQAAIVQALHLLPGNVRLIVCGEGPERGSLLELAKGLGVADRVSLLGFRDDMADVMAACDCLVFPSIHEGLPVSVMEAMAAGLPVVASDIRGIEPDLLSDRESGLVLPEATPGAIASAVSELMKDAGLRDRLIRGSVESVRRFGLEEALETTSNVYEGGGARC